MKLRRAEPGEAPVLAQLAGKAFEKDRYAEFKAVVTSYSHGEEMLREIEGYLADPKHYLVVCAIDEETDNVIGWVCWGFRGLDRPADSETSNPQSAAVPAKETSDTAGGQAIFDTTEKKEEPAPGSIEFLDNIIDADYNKWMNEFMPPGTRCMYIVSINVNPQYQRSGIGKTLVQYGTALADDANVFCWVHASEKGYFLFQKAGFEEVGRLDIDMDEYCKGIQSPNLEADSKWGHYVFRYLKRPQSKLAD